MGTPSTTAPAPALRLHDGSEPFQPLRLVLQPSGVVLDVNEPDVVVGRHTEVGLRLPLPDVSRRHCRLRYESGTWHITDLNSLNGIKLNGENVVEATLGDGDTLRIGGFSFKVEIGSMCPVRSILQTLSSPPVRKAG